MHTCKKSLIWFSGKRLDNIHEVLGLIFNYSIECTCKWVKYFCWVCICTCIHKVLYLIIFIVSDIALEIVQLLKEI
jgi:hypothetical protein